MSEKIKDWNGSEIEIVKSKSGVIIIKDIFNNLLMPKNLNIFPIELIQKLYKDNHQSALIGGLTPSQNTKNYEGETIPNGADNYCYLQSINSEDALVWSYFSHLIYGSPREKYKFTKDLFNLLEIGDFLHKSDSIEYFLWRRIPHVDTRGMSGSEIDFGIITNRVFLIGEAKWNSGEGKDQGKDKDTGQLTLRQRFLDKFQDEFLADCHHLSIPSQRFLVYLTRNSVNINTLKDIKPQNFKNLTWDEIVKIKSHPQYVDVNKYYNWKKKTCEEME